MGESEKRDEPFTITDEVGDILAVMDAVGLERSAVYGRSRGGMLAQELALSHPGRVSSLILSGTSHRGPGAVGYTEPVQKAMSFTPDVTREQIFEGQNAAMASPGWKERDPAAFAYVMKTDLEAPPRRFAVARQQGSLEGWTSKDRLHTISCPTLVICGADDGMVPPENSRQIASLIPNSRLEFIPQCGHLPMLEKPQEVANLVLEFLR
jgi:pimeloyl-ACP methyl ester carboxylesterase